MWSLVRPDLGGSVAALARVFAEYFAQIVPVSGAVQTFIAVVVIAIVTAVNVWGTRQSSDLQNWTTLVKAAVIVILSAILLSLGRHAGEMLPAMRATQHGSTLLSNFGLAMIAVLWAYEGWQFGTYSAGEVVDPQKAFPRAFLMGSLVLIGLYLIAIAAYLFALGPAATAASDTIAAASVNAVLGSWAGKIIALTILISTFSAANSVILTAPRVFYAMAHDNLFFKKLAVVHVNFRTPVFAIVALGVWSAVLVCAGKSKSTQWVQVPTGASGSSAMSAKLCVPCGAFVQESAGEISAPSQVNFLAISPLLGKLVLDSVNVMVLAPCASIRTLSRGNDRKP
jgi:amino acid transporter